jgi:DNA adenine methylase
VGDRVVENETSAVAYTRSILRYPGGKTRFAPFIQEALSLNKARVRVFAEPFCGGAGVAISLLEAIPLHTTHSA